MSAATDRLASLHQRRGYVLSIAGVRYRYSTHAGITTGSNLATALDTLAGVAYVDLPMLTALSDYSASIDVAGGVAEYDPINITLASDGTRAVAGDPGIIFGRILPRSLTPVGQLAATATQDDATLTVDASAGFTVGGVYHIGSEAIQVTAKPDPTTLTVTRAEGGTAARYHAVDTVSAVAPGIYDEPATWLARRAVLYACGLSYDGRRVTDFVEVYRGFLDESPQVDGERVTLALSPLTALLDVGVGPPQETTGLLQGWHYFSPPYGTTFRVGQEIDPISIEFDGASVAGPPVEWPLTDQSIERIDAAFDMDLVNGATASLPGHPRTPKFAGVDDWLTGAPPAATGIEGTGLDHPAGGAGRLLSSRASAEGRAVPMATAAGAVEWPGTFQTQLHASCLPADHTGLDGLWYAVRTDLDSGRLGFDLFTLAVAADGWAPSGSVYLFPDEPVGQAADAGNIGRFRDWTTGADVPLPIRDEALHYPIRLSAPDAGTEYRPADGIAGQYGVVRAEMRTTPAAFNSGEGDAPAAFIPIEAIARAWYQRGEPEVLCEQELYIPPGGSLRVRVDYADPDTGEEAVTSFTATAATAVLDGGGSTIGYRLTVAANERASLPSFGDWPGLSRVRLSPVVEFTGDTIGTIIGTILQSNGGAGGAEFDTAPYGAGLTDADVDVESIKAIVPPGNLGTLALRLEAGSIVRDVIDPLLRAIGYALTMQTDAAGQCRLTAVPLGFEGSTDAVGSLSADSLGARARWGTDDRIANRFTYLTDWDADTGESTRTVIVNDLASQQAYQDVAELEFELRGFDVLEAGSGADAATLLRPIYQRHRALLAHPRRTWSVEVGSGPGLFANLGAVYLVTHPQLRGYSDTMGITALPGRVTEVTVGLQSEPTSLVLQHYGANARGWNASAVLTGAPVGLVCTVSANVYSPALSVGGRAVQVDADTFAAGDAVLIAAPWDADSASSTTVTAVSGNTITLAAVPGGATTGWVIWPADYGTASDSHKQYAYHADAAGTVGADDGAEIA